MTYPLPSKMHQILTPEGKLVADPPELPPEQLLSFYRWMIFGRTISDRMLALQRQGRMGTFGPLNGQEAASVGMAAPLQKGDWIGGSYREFLAYFVKGLSPMAIMESFKGYVTELYTPEVGCLPTQIVLATQVLHLVGIAMGIQYDGKANVAVSVCGDGATSEGDFNEALNTAAIFKAPVVFVVQNNGWAISVPRHKQTAAEYIAHRGPAFGMPGHIVDGNDVLASYQVMAECVERARAGEGPSLIEMITYRMGAHTTADDPTKYRPPEELEVWAARDPIERFQGYLQTLEILKETDIAQIQTDVKAEIQGYVDALESRPPQDPGQIFDLVYKTPTPQLLAQKEALLQFLETGD